MVAPSSLMPPTMRSTAFFAAGIVCITFCFICFCSFCLCPIDVVQFPGWPDFSIYIITENQSFDVQPGTPLVQHGPLSGNESESIERKRGYQPTCRVSAARGFRKFR